MGWHFLSLCINYSPVPRHSLNLEAPHLLRQGLTVSWLQVVAWTGMLSIPFSNSVFHFGRNLCLSNNCRLKNSHSQQWIGGVWGQWPGLRANLKLAKWSGKAEMGPQLRWKLADTRAELIVLSPAMSLLYKLWKKHLWVAAVSKRRQLHRAALILALSC